LGSDRPSSFGKKQAANTQPFRPMSAATSSNYLKPVATRAAPRTTTRR
jgi:hypothetical protein